MTTVVKNINGVNPKGKLFLEAREGVSEELRSQFDSLVEDYAFASFRRYSRGYISYLVIADLIKAGWRGPPPGTS